MQFPPPTKGPGDEWETVDYPAGRPGGGFIFPPPRVTDDGGAPLEVARQVGQQLAQWGDLAEWTTEAVNNLGVVVEDYGPQITDLIENRVLPWAVPTIAPLSQTINRRADPTFQLSDFMVPPMGGTDSRGDAVTTAATGLQQGGSTKNRAYIAFLTPAVTRAYERLNFMVSAVTNPCPMDVGVYLVDPETKVLHRQVLVQDVSIPLGESVATVEFDDPWVSVQGSYVAIVWLQRGTGNTRFLLGLNDTPRPLGTQVYPHKISAIHTSTNVASLPATINGTTQTDFGFWFTPYAELSENVGERLQVFTEKWPDVGTGIGRPWVAITSTGIGSGGGYTAAYGSGLRVSLYDTPLATDYVRVKSSIYNPGNETNSRRSTLIVRGTNNCRSGLGLSAISGQRYELISWADRAVTSDEDWNDRTVIAAIARVPREGDQIEIDYLGGQVTVRINGTAHIDGQAVGGPQGSAGRFVGIQNRRQSFIGATFSPWFGPWSARDLSLDDGDDEGAGEGG